MENTSAPSFFQEQEQRERKGKKVFLLLAVGGSAFIIIAAIAGFGTVGILPYMSFIFWDDDLVGNRLDLFNFVHYASIILTPLLQTVFYIVTFFGKQWARMALAGFNFCNSLIAVLIFASAILSPLGGEWYNFLMILTMAVYYILSSAVLFGYRPIKAFVYAQRK